MILQFRLGEVTWHETVPEQFQAEVEERPQQLLTATPKTPLEHWVRERIMVKMLEVKKTRGLDALRVTLPGSSEPLFMVMDDPEGIDW